jgi:hypothetical protein
MGHFPLFLMAVFNTVFDKYATMCIRGECNAYPLIPTQRSDIVVID